MRYQRIGIHVVVRAGKDIQQDGLAVAQIGAVDAVDVGQLVADDVDLPVIGISLQLLHGHAGPAGDGLPRENGRLVRISVPVVLALEQFDPDRETLLFRDGADRVGVRVVGMELSAGA